MDRLDRCTGSRRQGLTSSIDAAFWLSKRPQASACSLDSASLDLFTCVRSKSAPSLPDIREDSIEVILGASKRAAASRVPAAPLAVGAKDVVMPLQIVEPWKTAGIGVIAVLIFWHLIERDYVADEHLADEDVCKWSPPTRHGRPVFIDTRCRSLSTYLPLPGMTVRLHRSVGTTVPLESSPTRTRSPFISTSLHPYCLRRRSRSHLPGGVLFLSSKSHSSSITHAPQRGRRAVQT